MRYKTICAALFALLLAACDDLGPSEEELKELIGPFVELYGIDPSTVEKDRCEETGEDAFECFVTATAVGSTEPVLLRPKVRKANGTWFLDTR